MQNEEELLSLTKQKEEIEAEKKQIAEVKDAEIAGYKKNIDDLAGLRERFADEVTLLFEQSLDLIEYFHKIN